MHTDDTLFNQTDKQPFNHDYNEAVKLLRCKKKKLLSNHIQNKKKIYVIY